MRRFIGILNIVVDTQAGYGGRTVWRREPSTLDMPAHKCVTYVSECLNQAELSVACADLDGTIEELAEYFARQYEAAP